jgi:hypothetical protein
MMSTAVNGAFRTLRWRSPGVLQECLREESPGVTVASLARKASRWGLTNGWSGRVSIVSSGREATIRGADGFSYITHGTTIARRRFKRSLVNFGTLGGRCCLGGALLCSLRLKDGHSVNLSHRNCRGGPGRGDVVDVSR